MKDNNLSRLIKKLALPKQYESYLSLYFEPLVEIIHNLSLQIPVPVIAINGSQGAGKTTAAMVLQELLESKYQYRVAIISIDDFYHSKEKRRELSESLHPLFMTRGVPGTHDIDLAIETFNQLKKITNGETALIPRFDKFRDDRKSPEYWDKVAGPVSVIIFEGWCVASTSMDPYSLDSPINKLERIEDNEGLWRKASNQFLAQQYQLLFKQIDWLLMLKTPGFDMVFQWRLLQEQKLAKTLTTKSAGKLLDEQQLKRFIQHFQRLTEHNLLTIPTLADAVISLDEQHRMTQLEIKNPLSATLS
ncbi:MAG: phosphoribulokinase [gamma proteobacterium symbiont of Taylorina sp.]|nr:phosphoribulokinase [gamma proteobacterium symbiont of Taylorina sp.]